MDFFQHHELRVQAFRQALEGSESLAIRRFRAIVWQYYKAQGRSHPWRETDCQYHILVSEFMLQQTQVARVLPKYQSFLKRFPTAKRLAKAPLAAVLREWQGLGYNRRGLALQRCAQIIVEEYDGELPSTEVELQQLPGIGPYTAAALRSFAHGKPSVMVETNIRAVMLYFFFKGRRAVSEEEVREVVATTMHRRDPRNWYYALMDYGAYLKANGVRTNQLMRGYRKQSKFEGSHRQIRGAVLRHLSENKQARKSKLGEQLGYSSDRLEPALEDLLKEGLIRVQRGIYRLPS